MSAGERPKGEANRSKPEVKYIDPDDPKHWADWLKYDGVGFRLMTAEELEKLKRSST